MLIISNLSRLPKKWVASSGETAEALTAKSFLDLA
jgi:hypothetical protein